MGREYLSWEKLDNTANIFPVIADENMTNTYRICCELNEKINEAKLQQAVDIVLPKFPGFDLRMRKGIFWFYMEENGKPAPRVEKESDYPCRYIHESRNNSYMFRVSYYRNRINLEVFHVLADGMGGLTFLREIVYQYLRFCHEELQEKYGDGFSPETSLNREDSFKANFRKRAASTYKVKKAFLIKGEKLPYNGFGVISGYMSVKELKAAGKKYGISINEYLISAFVLATYRAFARRVDEKHPIRVAVPVNLRPFFDSITTKNFFVMVSAEFIPEEDKLDYTFEEVCSIIHESLKSQITKEHLEEIFSYNVTNEDYLVARAVPLPIKNIAMKFIYTQSALANTTTITNVGNVSVLDGYRDYIRMFYGYIPFSKGQNLKGTIMSYGDRLAYSFTSAYEDTTIVRDTFRTIAADDVNVSIETNGVFN